MTTSEVRRVADFYKENPQKFQTKRQASKYLNQMGTVWKNEHNIPLTDPKRSK